MPKREVSRTKSFDRVLRRLARRYPDLPVAVEKALERFAESGPPARYRQTGVGARPVYKERLPLGRAGKRGGARLIAYCDDELVLALFVYVKSDQETISPTEIQEALDAAEI